MYHVIEAIVEDSGNVRLDGALKPKPPRPALVIVSDDQEFESNLSRIRDFLEGDLPKRSYMPPMVDELDDPECELEDEDLSLRRDVWDDGLRRLAASDQLIAEVRNGNELAIEAARKVIKTLAGGTVRELLIILRAMRKFDEAVQSGEEDIYCD
jgi:hypothetical protein